MITILTQPNQYHAAYNPVLYKLDSTNKNQLGFRYVVEIYNAGTSTLIHKQLVAPDPTDSGYATVDVSRIIQNRVDKHLTLTNPGIINPTDSYYRYDIKFGESFIATWPFTDYINSGGSIALTGSTNHPYVVGQQIRINTTSVYTDARKNLNNIWTVTEVLSPTSFKINLDFIAIGSFSGATPGSTNNAQNNKTVALDLANLTNRYTYNASQSPVQFNTQTGSLQVNILAGSGRKFLTTQPETFTVTLIDKVWFNALDPNNVGARLRFTNDDGDSYDLDTTPSFITKLVGVGPNNLAVLTPQGSAVLPLIKPNTQSYFVRYINDMGINMCDPMTFTIDYRCKINDYSITFMDRYGSYSAFTFALREIRTIQTNKETFVKQAPLNTASDSTQVYFSEVDTVLTLNTNWLTEAQNLYFEELLTSPYTYLFKDGVTYSIFVEDGGFETILNKNKRLYMRTINVKINTKTNINI
jgi:hypothetical protein